MAQNIGQAARGATSTLRRVDSTPQSLLFGPAPAARTREAGFAGFGSTSK